MTLTHPLFSIAPLAVTPPLTSPLLPLLLPFLAHGKCYRIWVLTTYQFFYLSLSLRSFAPTSVPLPSIFRGKAFAAAHRSDEDRQAYISASRRASSVIAKAKAEAWQTTCSSLSPTSNPKSVLSLLNSIAGSSSSSSSSPNFPNYYSPRESASVYAAYLKSHFSISQPKALRSRARGHLSELRRATCPVEYLSFFCTPFTLAEFLAAASNLSSSTATGSDKDAYPMLKHLPRSGMDFLLYIFNLSWSLVLLSFHLEDIFHYSHSQDGKSS